MDFITSLFVPKQMKRHKNLNFIIAFAIFCVAAYLICIPQKVRSKNVDSAFDINAYACQDFYDFETDYAYSNITAINAEIVDGLLKYDDDSIHVFSLYSPRRVIYLVFDKNCTNYSNTLDPYKEYSLHREQDSYCLLFAKDFFYLAEVDESLNTLLIQGSNYSAFSINFKDYETTNEFMQGVGTNLALFYNRVEASLFSLSAILMVIIVPFILIVVMWLIFKKNSTLTKFGEYYAIASICTIAPTIIYFIIGWFTSSFINMYGSTYVLYYILCVFLINTKKE